MLEKPSVRVEGLLLTPDEVLNLLGRGVVGRNRLYNWLRSGRLPSVKDGSRLFIARAAVERLAADIASGRWLDEGRQ
jgi:excisionase family DNA binding protein